MQLTVQVISGVLTIAVLALTIIGVLRTRKTNKPAVKRAEPIIKDSRKSTKEQTRSSESTSYSEGDSRVRPASQDYAGQAGNDGPGTNEVSPELSSPTFSSNEVKMKIERGSSINEHNIEEDNTRIPEIISITLLAEKDRPYSGYELLQALLSNGLRFGKMNIFHAFENPNGTGNILFSCASAKKPGTFDIKNMGPFSTPGLTFFIQLSNKIDNSAALDAMLSTAELIILDLGGVIIDNEKKPLKDDKVSVWQKQIRAYEKNQHEQVA